MSWFFLAFASAIFVALRDLIVKQTTNSVNIYTVAWCMRFFTFIFLLPLLIFQGIPTLLPGFWSAVAVSVAINTVTTILYIKALKLSDLSLAPNLLNLTPLFLLITSPILIGEFPTILGLIGVLFIVAGTYALNIGQRHMHILAPFKSLWSNKGSRYMLFVAMIWSVSSIIDKIAVQSSSAIFYGAIDSLLLAVALTPITAYYAKNVKTEIKTYLKPLLLIGLFTAGMFVTQLAALEYALVTYVISVKRLSILISIILGAVILKEKNIKERLIGGIIMIIGVVLISIS